jgi:hypothetical protein
VQPLQRLVGTWLAKGATFTMAGKAQKVDITIACSATAGGHGVLCQTKIAAPGMVIEETDLFGYDAAQQRYHWFAVTSMGDTHDHVGLTPVNDRALVFAHSGFSDGKPMQEVLRLTVDATGKKLDFRNDGVVDGQPLWQVSAMLAKQ